MEGISALKVEGNEFFKAAVKCPQRSEKRRQLFIDACLKYAKALEAIVSVEFEALEDSTTDALPRMKSNLFLNLAMTNFNLEDFTESRRCCNAAMAFVNDPSLLVNHLGEACNINEDQIIIEPLHPNDHQLVAKILFRRAKSLLELSLHDCALRDIGQALILCPNDKAITIFKNEVNNKIDTNKPNGDKNDGEDSIDKLDLQSSADCDVNDCHKLSMNSLTSSNLCHNGGLCLLRHAYWSQTVEDVSVHIPVNYVERSWKIHDSPSSRDNLRGYIIKFSSNSCTINSKSSSENDNRKLELALCYGISPSESTWYMTNFDNVNYVAIVFHKIRVMTEFAGCEWWDRVFDGDEKIETLSCTVGADVSQLPQHARDHAEREHDRFQKLDVRDQTKELNAIRQYKEVLAKSEVSTRPQVVAEDNAIQEVPQRAEMLEALRDEFPRIQFTAK